MEAMTMRATHGPWTITYSGGRTADIYHAEYDRPVDAIQVVQYDWEAGEVEEELTQDHLEDALVRWAEDYGPDYQRNLRYTN